MTGPGGKPKRHRAALAWATLALAVLAGACTSSAGGTKPIGANTTADPPPGATSSTTAAATTTVDPTKTAILNAYRQDEAVYLSVAGHYPIVPLDPRLPQVMTGAELVTVQKNLTLAALAGQYGRGVVDLAPVLTSMSGNTAMITDCSFDHTVILNGRTNQVVTPAGTQRTLQKVTMDLENGVWKIGDELSEGSGCVPAA